MVNTASTSFLTCTYALRTHACAQAHMENLSIEVEQTHLKTIVCTVENDKFLFVSLSLQLTNSLLQLTSFAYPIMIDKELLHSRTLVCTIGTDNVRAITNNNFCIIAFYALLKLP